jgi:hypothetical protein
MRQSDSQTETELRSAHFPEVRLSRPERFGTGRIDPISSCRDPVNWPGKRTACEARL